MARALRACVCVRACVSVCDRTSTHHEPSCNHASKGNLAALDEVSLERTNRQSIALATIKPCFHGNQLTHEW